MLYHWIVINRRFFAYLALNFQIFMINFHTSRQISLSAVFRFTRPTIKQFWRLSFAKTPRLCLYPAILPKLFAASFIFIFYRTIRAFVISEQCFSRWIFRLCFPVRFSLQFSHFIGLPYDWRWALRYLLYIKCLVANLKCDWF